MRLALGRGRGSLVMLRYLRLGWKASLGGRWLVRGVERLVVENATVLYDPFNSIDPLVPIGCLDSSQFMLVTTNFNVLFLVCA